MATLDLKDAYFLVSINKNDRKMLRFQWNSDMWPNQLFEFNVLPFGLCTAPYVFTKLLKPVLQHLRTAGHLSVAYLDDFCCIGNSYNDCLQNVNYTKNILTSLGFIINTKKSQMIPSNSCKFLGFIFNTVNMTISLPDDKREKIKQKTKILMGVQQCSVRQFAEFIGLLTSACPAVKYGWLYTKLFEREKFLALNHTENYNRQMKLSPILNKDFKWWLNNIKNTCNPIRSIEYILEIFSDASTTGWGVSCGAESASGN